MKEVRQVQQVRLAECEVCDNGYLLRVCGKLGRDIGGVSGANRFINHVWKLGGRHIIALPCGSGKSTSAYSIILEHYEVNKGLVDGGVLDEEDAGRIWLVVDTLATGRERIADLVKLGIPTEDIGFYHSFNEEECHALSGKKYRYKDTVNNRNLCRDCKSNSRCLSYNARASGHCNS